jgi:hypothetical protein
MKLPRTVSVEALDHLSPDDPSAMQSRRDLMRVHRAMGTRSLMRRGWQALVSPDRADAPLRILELGAGDGSLLLGLARCLSPPWRRVQLCLLDRQNIVAPATLSGFAEAGWDAQVEVEDVLSWAARQQEAGPGPPSARWDLITTALFLHHFEGEALDGLLAAIARSCDRFYACEPSRSWLALAGSHLVGALGANAVTREDAVLSVHAGFRGHEISSRWPQTGGRWQMHESPAGLFSHCFSARRDRAFQ